MYICTENNQKYREVFDNDANNTINDKEDVISKSDDGEIAIEENIITRKSAQNKE